MNTDKQLFQIFAACPDGLFELAGLESPGKSEWRSFTIKALQRDTHGLIVPADKSQPLTIVDWLEQRFPQKGKREIEIMLLGELPELEQTQSGKDLIRIGEKRGEKRGADMQLDRAMLTVAIARFGDLSKPLQARLQALPRKTKEQLLNFVATCESLPKLKDWLDGHAN